MRLISLILLILSSSSVFSQEDTGVINSSEIKMTGDGKLTYKYGAKIGDDPIFKDTVKVNSEVGYSFVDKKVNSDFQVKAINAPKLKMLEPLVKLYKGYAALGFSDFKSPPYFDLNYSTIRKRHYNAGFALNHISQEQEISGVKNARYTNSNAMFFGKKFYKKSTWYSSLDYDYNSFRSYGFNNTQVDGSDEKSLLFGYSIANLQTGLKSNVKKKGKFGYDVSVIYDQFLEDQLAVAEHKVGLASNFNWKVKTNPIDFIMDVDFGSSYLNSANTSDEHSSVVFDLGLKLNKKSEKYDVSIGVKSFFQTDNERSLWAFPFIEADYSFVKDVLHVFGRLTTDFSRKSYLDFVDVNPFITDRESVLTTVTKQDFMAGLKGAFNSKSSFNIGVRYKNIVDMPLYYNVGDFGYNKFQILKDDVKQRQFFAELMWDGKKLDFGVKGEYNIYDVYQNEAFHLPNVYGELNASYNIQDKIEVGTQMFFYGKQLALESFDSQNRAITKDLDPIFDFNFNVKYNYSKRLGAFLKVNNILNTKHVRWDQYSSYGLNFLFGVGYSF